MSGRRKLAIGLVVWLALFESSAWMADAAWGFRGALLDGLETARTSREPVAYTAVPWPDGTLRVRVPDMYGPRAEPYRVGGVVIDDAWIDAKQDFVRAEDLPRDGRTRVFTLGESAVLGYPYRFEDTFERRLERARPDLEVVNVGQAGWTSGQIAGVADRVLAEFDPDVLVLYVGNNEWIRWTPQASSGLDVDVQEALARSRALAAALYLGHARALAPADTSVPLVGHAYTLAHPDRALDVQRWRDDRARFLDTFRSNLAGIVRAARAHRVRVVVCTVPFSYRLAPSFKHAQPDAFARAHADEVRDLEQRAGAALDDEQAEAALSLADRAAALDDGPAIVHYLRGEALERLGRRAEAEAAYAASRDRMVGNLGGRLAVNEVIADVARAEGAELLDLRARFDERVHASGRGYSEGLIQDDCHPTPDGHQEIAEALAAVL